MRSSWLVLLKVPPFFSVFFLLAVISQYVHFGLFQFDSWLIWVDSSRPFSLFICLLLGCLLFLSWAVPSITNQKLTGLVLGWFGLVLHVYSSCSTALHSSCLVPIHSLFAVCSIHVSGAVFACILLTFRRLFIQIQIIKGRIF